MIFALLAAPVCAESISYFTRIGQEARTSTVTVASVGDKPCVSLKGLVTAFGGQVTVSSNTIKVSLLDRAATMTVGDTEVAASQQFTLQHPPSIYDNDIYIAVSDVAPFFQYAFGLEVTTGQPAASADQAAAPMPTGGQKIRVILDAGHGGTDPGASGQGTVPEKDITRAIATRVGKLLDASCQTAYTRAEDNTLTTAERVSMANVALKGSLLVSIHVGASVSPTASGFELFCPTETDDPNAPRSLALARSISNGMSQATGATPQGLHQAPCRLFANLQMPGVMIEVGFITNPKEEPLLVNAEYQDKIAQGIANGIVAYVGGKAP